MGLLIVTACTNRKTVSPQDRIQARELPSGSQADVAWLWKNWLAEPDVSVKAGELYSGRGFAEAIAAARIAAAELWIVSAGVGLVSAQEEIPAYDLTLTTGSPNTIGDRVVKELFNPSLWWRELGTRYEPARSIAALVRKHPEHTILLSISTSYLDLIAGDLLSLSDGELTSLRLIGPLHPGDVPPRLRPCLMPYDDRLNGPESPINGTRADFPQRALRHFVESVWLGRETLDRNEHIAQVASALSNLSKPESLHRQQCSDDELIDLITRNWSQAEGQSSKMLRLLRDHHQVACEQGRFQRLFASARGKMPGARESVEYLTIRAVRTVQGNGIPVFAFFVPGSKITEIADISRIQRDSYHNVAGFQRNEIRRHVNGIVAYLDQGDVLFPNSITLAFSRDIEFQSTRGRDPGGALESSQAGTLHIPIYPQGKRAAWIVDGQQRSLALAKTHNRNLHVPVVAFVAEDIETQREQFILVNKAKPLPVRLINELLPEVDTELPRDLVVRKIPSALCELLSTDPTSPFHGLLKRLSHQDDHSAVITDSAVVDMIRISIANPLGALAQHKGLGKIDSDTAAMYRALSLYWSAVKSVFPNAWGRPPEESRLMHSAGIRAMGVLMDRILNRATLQPDPRGHVVESLRRIAPNCRWTQGTWEAINLRWNDLQQTSRHIKQLSELLTHLDYAAWSERDPV